MGGRHADCLLWYRAEWPGVVAAGAVGPDGTWLPERTAPILRRHRTVLGLCAWLHRTQHGPFRVEVWE